MKADRMEYGDYLQIKEIMETADQVKARRLMKRGWKLMLVLNRPPGKVYCMGRPEGVSLSGKDVAGATQ